MKLNRLSKVALVATAAAGLVAGSVVPANAATRSTVVIVTSNALTSLNPSVFGQSLTINTDVSYLQGFGFYYYNEKPEIVKNTTIAIARDSIRPAQVKWESLLLKYTRGWLE